MAKAYFQTRLSFWDCAWEEATNPLLLLQSRMHRSYIFKTIYMLLEDITEGESPPSRSNQQSYVSFISYTSRCYDRFALFHAMHRILSMSKEWPFSISFSCLLAVKFSVSLKFKSVKMGVTNRDNIFVKLESWFCNYII